MSFLLLLIVHVSFYCRISKLQDQLYSLSTARSYKKLVLERLVTFTEVILISTNLGSSFLWIKDNEMVLKRAGELCLGVKASKNQNCTSRIFFL